MDFKVLLKTYAPLLLSMPIRRSRGLTKTVLVMKQTGFLLLATILHVSARSTAQMVTYEAKNAPLAQVFAAIKQQTGYVFFYSPEDLEDATLVTVKLWQVPLAAALQAILANQPLAFTIQGNTIGITRKVKLSEAVASAPPPGDIHGHVTDSLGSPLGGASVSVKGSKKGVSTDDKGNFELKGVDNNATIVVSYAGFESQEIRLNGKNEISLRLKQSMSKLDETVVKGYYTTTDRLNTGDVTTVTGEDINKQPVTDPILALEGRVPGLYIAQASGAPGAYGTIRIEGQNSIFNGSDPLYIVDGVPFGSTSLTNPYTGGGMLGNPNVNGGNTNGVGMSPFNSLNSADIESIVVLKDADATAIYGSRGANGVILITTKKGKAGDTRIDANVYSGAGQVTRRLHLLNTPQYLAMRHEALQNDGVTPVPANNYDLTVWDTTRYTDWQKVLIGNSAPFTNAQLNLSGGSASTQFSTGGSFSRQGTVFPGSYSDEKAAGFINLTHSSNNGRFHAQMTVNYINDNNNLPGIDLTKKMTLAPDAPKLKNPDGTLNWQIVNGTGTWTNPLAYTLNHASAKTSNLVSNLSLGYQLLPDLSLKANFGYNQMQMDQSIISLASSVAPPNNENPNDRRNLLSTTEQKTWIVEPQLDYNARLLKGQFNALVGTTFQANTQSILGMAAYGFGSDALVNYPAAASTFSLDGNLASLYHYDALFARLGYSWEDKYLINLTGRRDGSSRFGPGKQFGNFGAIGVGWVFSKEGFIANNLHLLSFGKLKASYGITGNDQIGNYQYLSTYQASSNTYQNLATLNPTGLTNANFAWEQVKKFNAGLELGFVKDRVLLSANYFRNRSSDELIGYILPSITGFSGVEANLPATVQNTGTEFTLNTTNVQSKNFRWSSSINLTLPANKLISYPNLESSGYGDYFAIGHSLSIVYVYHNTGVNPATGVFSFATKNANGLPSSPTDYIVSKPLTQTLYGGFDNKFVYKGVQLDFLIQFVKQTGYDYYEWLNNPGPSNYNVPTSVLSRWRTPGQLTDMEKFTQARAAVYTAYSDFKQSDGVISDASFVRLKNVVLSYDLPIHQRPKGSNKFTQIYIQCQNLLTITNYRGLDPENQSFALPTLRMITGGIKASF